MKKAYLIFAYNNPKKVDLLINSLNYNCDFFIHLDKKANIKDFEYLRMKYQNCFFTDKRFFVCWGGWSQVKAIMEMLKKAINYSTSYTHLILITETDYPIKSNIEIDDYLNSKKDVEFVMALDCTKYKEISSKINRKWWFDFPFKGRMWRFLVRITNHIVLRFSRKKSTCLLNGLEVPPFFGQMLFAFTPSCAAHILDVYQNDKTFNKYMKTVYVPCEFYYQTIAFNSVYRKKIMNYGKEHILTKDFSWAPLHFYDYSYDIKVFDETDFDTIVDSNKLFFRKAVVGKSDLLMKKIDEYRNSK